MAEHASSTLDVALADARESFSAAVARRDAHAASQVYDEDARLMLPAAEPLDGRPAIEAFWRAGLDAGLRAFHLDPRRIVQEATFALEIGRYTLRSGPPDEERVVERGAYLIVHRPSGGGGWRRAVELLSPERGTSGANRGAGWSEEVVRGSRR